MKHRANILALGTILGVIVAVAAGCKSDNAAPAKLTCPSGSHLVGEPPPNGDEQLCKKTVKGEDLKEGPMVLYRPGGMKMMEGYYKNGKQDGEWTLYYEGGSKKSIDHYKDGVEQGEHVSWYENGQIDAKGQYKDGEQEGVWKRWGPDGIKNWEETYKDGKKIS